jgi:hypothetical protein
LRIRILKSAENGLILKSRKNKTLNSKCSRALTFEMLSVLVSVCACVSACACVSVSVLVSLPILV